MYRIVHNEQTGSYRVEKRGLFGWAFVSDPKNGDYLGFEDADAARNWIRSKVSRNEHDNRRWKVVADCNT